MTLGQKIKEARKKRKLTQSELCGERITRNMLSAIECDKATPSLDTLTFIAASLDLPLSYLLSPDDNLFFHQKAEKISEIKRLFANGRYKKCTELIGELDGSDDELSYLSAVSYFQMGRAGVLSGSLKNAVQNLELSKKHSLLTIYHTEREETLTELYLAIAKNIQNPLLELNKKQFEIDIADICDMDLYKFMLRDKGYIYSNEIFAKHLEAKELISNRKIIEALALMKEIESAKTQKNYNAYWILDLYADIESCYKQLGDFENAYKYSVKRMTLLEEFKS